MNEAAGTDVPFPTAAAALRPLWDAYDRAMMLLDDVMHQSSPERDARVWRQVAVVHQRRIDIEEAARG